jgi:hypothetical protein
MANHGIGESKRAALGFLPCALKEFHFLTSDLGFHLIEQNDTRIRYESDRRFVNVYHGRGSYELGVEFGRWIQVEGETREEVFPLRNLLALDHDLRELGYGGLTATTRPLVENFVHRLAAWTKMFTTSILTDGDELFARARERNAVWSQSYLEGIRASRLRSQADVAWRRRDFDAVVNAYTEIDTELASVGLKPSERARLRYARKAARRDNV